MSYSIVVAGVDVTASVPEESIELGGQATIESTTGELLVDDDAGVGITAFKPRKVVTWTEDSTTPDTTLARGRVEPIDYSRGTLFADDAHQKKVSISDQNSHLRGIIVDGWARPEETDYERVMALVAAYLSGAGSSSGYARDSTDLDPAWVINADTVTMPAETYKDTDPASVLDDCTRAANKIAFVTVDNELFYAMDTYTGYAASLAIRDDTADTVNGVGTVWAPDWTGRPGTESGQEFLSGAKLKYGTSSSVVEHRAGIAATYDKWEETIYDDGAKGNADATTRLSKILDARGQLDKTYACSIEIDETQVDKVKVGQTLTFRAAAANVLSPTTVRVARLMWEIVSAGPPRIYRANLELSKPKKLAPYGHRGAAEIIARENAPPPSAVTGDAAELEEVVGACVSLAPRSWLRRYSPWGGAPEEGILGGSISPITGSWVAFNTAWSASACPIGGGSWTGWEDRESWYQFTAPADDPSYIGMYVTVDASGLYTNGDVGGYHIGITPGAIATGRFGDHVTIAGGVTGGTIKVYIPRNLIAWGAVNSIVLAPDWECARSFFTCNGSGYFGNPREDGRGGSGSYHGISPQTVCPVRFASGTEGLSGEVAVYGDTDGINRTFVLTDWDGTGTPELTINGLEQPSAAVVYNRTTRTATLDSAPPARAVLLWDYNVGPLTGDAITLTPDPVAFLLLVPDVALPEPITLYPEPVAFSVAVPDVTVTVV